jgi:DNA-binding NtrC family response regulator
MVERVAPHDSLVLIRGESGTGKELVAEAIHDASPRRGRPFVKVNCGALVESLLLSELFGHERGAFTGALQRRKGRFELADGGTLFLDEIGDISPQTQVALLRVLQTHEFERVGGTQPVRVDVRIVCATNRDLEAMVAAGRFREDLYYRLKGIEIDLPPLRARAEDIPDLVRHFLAHIAEERHTAAKDVTPAAMDALARYAWPGNIRELENVVRSVTLFADGPAIEARDLVEYVGAPRVGSISAPLVPVAPAAAQTAPAGPRPDSSQGDVYAWAVQNGVSLRDLKRKIELDCITQALAECGGNITRAAERLGMKRPRLSQLLKEYGLSQGRPGTEDKL